MKVKDGRVNIHGNSTKIHPHILSDETMLSLGFSRAKDDRMWLRDQSWLYIGELNSIAEFWFEVWGEGEDDFCIEVLEKNYALPYDYKFIRKLVEEEMDKFVMAGVITGYHRGDYI